MMFRPLPVMTVCVVVSLGILAMLGNWQWQRYGEKQNIATEEIEWVSLFGDLVHDEGFFVSTILNGRSAWKHVAVLQDSERDNVVLATHFITFQINPPDDAAPDGTKEFDFEDGVFLVPSKRNAITPKPDGNVFFSYDVEAIRARLPDAVAGKLRNEIYEPRLITVRDDAGDVGEINNPFADAKLADPLPPARHLGYALTWWGMGLGLIVIYLVYHAKAGRLALRGRS